MPAEKYPSFQMVGAKFRVKSNREFFGTNREILGVETGTLRAEIQTEVEGAAEPQLNSPHIGGGPRRRSTLIVWSQPAVPLLVVAKNLGHAETRMVEKYYEHLAPSYIVAAIRAGAPRFDLIARTNVAKIR